MTTRNLLSRMIATGLAAAMVLTGMPEIVRAAEPDEPLVGFSHSYTRNALLMDQPGADLPGVYAAVAQPGDDGTIGIPSLAKQNLEGMPTEESPAIIKGAAVPFERRASTGAAIRFDRINDEPIYAPYSMFRYTLLDEGNANGATGSHTKISGFDGTYVIIRVDVSELIKEAPAGSYLHYKQTDNKCMLVSLGEKVETETYVDGGETKEITSVTFSDALGGQAGSIALDGDAVLLKDKDGPCTDRTFVTFIVMSSGTLVAGADTGKEGAPPADFPISFYVDATQFYDVKDKDGNERPMIWDTTSNAVLYEDTREAVPEIPATTDPQKAAVTPATQYLGKFYNEAKSGGATVSNYTVMGSDLEIEVAVDETNDNSSPTQYWSLRRAMDYEGFNDHIIHLLCEVPMLNGLHVSGQGRKVALDLSSFDFQIANHSETGAAGLIVEDGATLTLLDASKTTGAELAVGNNANMLITGEGSTLVIDETCQMEVEYDAASTPAPTGTPTPTPTPTVELTNGVITIENGGKIVNNGVINVEGAENKAVDPATVVIRDTKDAMLCVGEGGTIENNGCMRVNGLLYNEGTIMNNGRYTDIIESNDPDKGRLIFHKGIQMSWKDDVTQGDAYGGIFKNGMGPEESGVVPEARFENNGDLVLVPGYLANYSAIENRGNIILSAVDEVIRPIVPAQDAPTVLEERVKLNKYVASMIDNFDEATITNAGGKVYTADIELVSNGRTGDILNSRSSDYDDIVFTNFNGKITNTDKGLIDVSYLSNSGTIENDSTSSITSKVVMQTINEQSAATFTDSASKKTADVYNAKKTTNNKTDTWTYVELASIKVSPTSQMVRGGECGKWALLAKTKDKTITDADNVRYYIQVDSSRVEDAKMESFALPANKPLVVTSPAVPITKTNIVYTFWPISSGVGGVDATLRVNDGESSFGMVRPTAMQDLMYNGTNQSLVTAGSSTYGIFQYRVHEVPENPDPGKVPKWSYDRPREMDAGTYKVDYRVVMSKDNDAVIDPGGTIEVTIAKRPLYIAAYDKASKKGENISLLTDSDYETLGLTDTDKRAVLPAHPGIIRLSTTADKDVPGAYPITVNVDLSPERYGFFWKNYEYKNEYGESRITDGVYYVSNEYLSVTPDPVTPAGGGDPVAQPPGIRSTLRGYDPQVSSGIVLTAKYKKDQSLADDKATVADIYYSADLPLDESNYDIDGQKTAPTFAAVGTDATVYYYLYAPNAETKTDSFSGSQRVVITKANQKAPGIKGIDTDGVLSVTPPDAKNENGVLSGLVPVSSGNVRAMEYRSAGSDVYVRPKYSDISLPAGTYYVRRVGDEKYYPSPDTEVVIPDVDTMLTVTFNANGGKFEHRTDGKNPEDPLVVEVFYGDTVSKPDDPVREKALPDHGYWLFQGWQYEGEDFDFSHPITANLELTADWNVEKRTVTFVIENYQTTATVEKGTLVKKPEDITLPGHTFKGWTKPGGGYFNFDTERVNDDITLTADCPANKYTVKFNSNDGGTGVTSEQSFEYGERKKLAANTFTRDGYTFGGWNTKADGKGKGYSDEQTVMNLSDTDGAVYNLYAQWRKNLDAESITVLVGGKAPEAYSAVYNGKQQRPNVTVKDGDKDISEYCRFVYSDNTAASTVDKKAKIRILPQSVRAPFAGEKVVEFTITKAPAPVYDAITKNYIYSDSTKETIDLTEYIPKDAGNIQYHAVSHDGTVSYNIEPRDEPPGVLTYELKPADRSAMGTITNQISTQNYEDITITVNVRTESLGLYEKVGKTYIIHRNASILEGKKVTLIPMYADGTIPDADRKVVWTSSNPDVATVTQAGVVTAMSPGETDITAKSEKYYEGEGSISATAHLIVREAVSSVTLTEKSHSIGVGERFEVSAEVLPYTAGQKLIWSCSKPDIADLNVSPDSLSAEVTGRKAGNVTVTAQAADGSGKKATVSVSVGDPVPEFDITCKSKDKTVKVGASTSFNVTWKGKKPKNTGLYWRVTTSTGGDASKIAKIDPSKGTLTGLSEGALRVTAVSTANNRMSASTEVYVYVPVKNVALNMTTATVSTAENANKPQLIAYVTPTVAGMSATGSTFGTKPVVKFEVDQKYRANLEVNVKGVLTAKEYTKDKIPVYATVTAYNGYSKKLTCKVKMADGNPLKGIKLSKSSLTVGIDNMEEISPSLNPVNPDGDAGFTWRIDRVKNTDPDPSGIAEVREVAKRGDVTRYYVVGKAAGKVKVVCVANGTVKKGNQDVHPEAVCTVTVIPSVTEIKFDNMADLTEPMPVGRSITVKTSFTPKGSKTALKWTSSNEAVATVNEKGVIKCIAPGGAKITATSLDNRDGAAIFNDVNVVIGAPVTKISPDKTKLTLGTQNGARYGKVGIALLLPANATYYAMKWTPDNANVSLSAVDKNDDPSAATYAFAGNPVTTSSLKLQSVAIRAEKPGVTKLTGETVDGSKKKIVVTVTVRGEVTNLRLTEKKPDSKGFNGVTVVEGKPNEFTSNMKKGTKLKITPLAAINGIEPDTIVAADRKLYGTYKKYTDLTASYRSSDTSKATVDKNGTIKISNTASGSVVIYASCPSGSKTSKLTITIGE